MSDELLLDMPIARVFVPLLEPARYKGAHGGRGSAKSHNFADMLVDRCLQVPGTRWLCGREHQNSLAQSVKQLLEDKIKQHRVSSLFKVLNTEIVTPGDGIISFHGLKNHTSDSVKSLEGYDGAWVEEAQRLSQRSLDLLRPTIRKPGSELWFSWNPDQPTDPIDQFFRTGERPPNSVVVEANFADNPWFPDVLREDMEYDKRRDPDRYAHVWLGKYNTRSEARVFRNWRIGVDEEFPAINAHSKLRYGADWGYAIDPSVLVELQIVGRTLFIRREAYKIGCEIDKLPELFGKITGCDKWPITADSARPETISYMRRHGFPRMRPSIKGANSLQEGVEFLRSFDIVVHPSCTHTIDELTLYSFRTDPRTQDVLPVLEDKKNHVIDAARYAIERDRRAKAGLL